MTRGWLLQRYCLGTLIAAFAALQLWQLLAPPFGGSRLWPFCAYDMFAFDASAPQKKLLVTLTDDAGDEYEAEAGNVLPLEFFRASALMRVVEASADKAFKQRFRRLTLERLNNEPWGAFDEVWAATTPRPGRVFVQMRVVEHIEPSPVNVLAVESRQ